MPVVVLFEGQTFNLHSWTIVGSVQDGIVYHVAILAKDVVDARLGDSVPVYHMHPPLTTVVPPSGPENEDNPDQPDDLHPEVSAYRFAKLHVTAWLEDLSEGNKRAMRRWHRRISEFFPETTRPKLVIPRHGQEAEVATFLKKCHFIAHPPIKKEVDPRTGNLKSIWYSCAGFVLDCFESNVVKKLLVSWDDPSFPTVYEDTIREVWCGRLELTPQIKDTLGLLDDDEPWPVVMPGYIMNAFKRRADEIRSEPFSPTEHDITVN